jgi:hypothetical protein
MEASLIRIEDITPLQFRTWFWCGVENGIGARKVEMGQKVHDFLQEIARVLPPDTKDLENIAEGYEWGNTFPIRVKELRDTQLTFLRRIAEMHLGVDQWDRHGVPFQRSEGGHFGRGAMICQPQRTGKLLLLFLWLMLGPSTIVPHTEEEGGVHADDELPLGFIYPNKDSLSAVHAWFQGSDQVFFPRDLGKMVDPILLKTMPGLYQRVKVMDGDVQKKETLLQILQKKIGSMMGKNLLIFHSTFQALCNNMVPEVEGGEISWNKSFSGVFFDECNYNRSLYCGELLEDDWCAQPERDYGDRDKVFMDMLRRFPTLLCSGTLDPNLRENFLPKSTLLAQDAFNRGYYKQHVVDFINMRGSTIERLQDVLNRSFLANQELVSLEREVRDEFVGGGVRKSAFTLLVFVSSEGCAEIEAAQHFTHQFEDGEQSLNFRFAKSSQNDHEDILKEIGEGKIDVLVTVELFSRSVSLPSVTATSALHEGLRRETVVQGVFSRGLTPYSACDFCRVMGIDSDRLQNINPDLLSRIKTVLERVKSTATLPNSYSYGEAHGPKTNYMQHLTSLHTPWSLFYSHPPTVTHAQELARITTVNRIVREYNEGLRRRSEPLSAVSGLASRSVTAAEAESSRLTAQRGGEEQEDLGPLSRQPTHVLLHQPSSRVEEEVGELVPTSSSQHQRRQGARNATNVAVGVAESTVEDEQQQAEEDEESVHDLPRHRQRQRLQPRRLGVSDNASVGKAESTVKGKQRDLPRHRQRQGLQPRRLGVRVNAAVSVAESTVEEEQQRVGEDEESAHDLPRRRQRQRLQSRRLGVSTNATVGVAESTDEEEDEDFALDRPRRRQRQRLEPSRRAVSANPTFGVAESTGQGRASEEEGRSGHHMQNHRLLTTPEGVYTQQHRTKCCCNGCAKDVMPPAVCICNHTSEDEHNRVRREHLTKILREGREEEEARQLGQSPTRNTINLIVWRMFMESRAGNPPKPWAFPESRVAVICQEAGLRCAFSRNQTKFTSHMEGMQPYGQVLKRVESKRRNQEAKWVLTEDFYELSLPWYSELSDD